MKMIQTWSYPAVFDREDGEIVVSFPDFPEALTGAEDEAAATALAIDALEEAVLAYLADGRPVPAPRAAEAGQVDVPLDPLTAARAALVQAMRDEQITNAALARRIERSEGAVRRLTNGATGVKIDTVLDALAALGRRAQLSIAAVA